MLRSIYTFLFVGLFCVIASAQPISEVPYKVKLETAEQAILSGDYYNAVEWLTKAYKESKDKDLAIKLADAYKNLRDFKKAASWYKRVLDRDKAGLYQKYLLEYGEVLKISGKYSDAFKVLNQFVQNSSDEARRADAMLHIMGIEQAGEFPENLDAIIRLGSKKINEKASESGAIPYDGGVYYSSLKRKKILVEGEKSDGEVYFKIYKSAKNSKGEYEKGEALGEQINREGYHTSSPSISKDGRYMYFIRTLIEDGYIIESSLYCSEKNGDDWGAAKEVEGINGDYSVKHPAVGELYGRDVIFFVSDMEGGFGGTDIYYAESLGGNSFKTPINLGPSINSPKDEITPFYRDGVLYFSSDGRPGYGGYDIYSTSWNGSVWSAVTNVGSGYNSTYDDFFYSMDEKGKQGYLISNRPAEGKRSLLSKTCCDDIFTINIRELIIDLQTIVNDENGPLNGVQLTLIDNSKGEDKLAPEVKNNINSNTATFSLDKDKSYKLLVERPGYYPDSLELNTVGILKNHTIKKTITLKALPKEPEFDTITINQPIRMSNIYYDFNDDEILPDAEKDLSVILDLMQRYPEMVIELSSHTDAQGTSSYNKKLSQRRAESAKKWLTSRGIDAARIKAVGYGEDVILNQCVNGVKCSDEEHRYNRRTEFKILEGPTSIEIKKTALKKAEPSGGMPMGFQVTKNTTIEWIENNLDLGTVSMDDRPTFSFSFKNTGNHPLVIKTVTACHCTTFEYTQSPILPGEIGKIKATYDGSKKAKGAGKYLEAINIICNTENIVEEALFNVEVVK